MDSRKGGGSTVRTKGTGRRVRNLSAVRKDAKGLNRPRCTLRGSNASLMIIGRPDSCGELSS